MNKSIFSKIFGGYLLIIILLFALIFFFSFRTIKTYYIQTLTGNLGNLARTLELKIKPLIEDGDYNKLDEFVKRQGKIINTRITVIKEDGVVIADSEKDPSLMENHKHRPEIVQAINNYQGNSLRYSSTVKEEMLYVALPVKIKNNSEMIILRVSLFVRNVNYLLNNLKIKILQIALIIILPVLLLTVFFSHSMSKPIKEMAIASKNIAAGHFESKIMIKEPVELKELADNFNFMTEKIKNLVEDLTNKQQELSGVISSIQEGLIVLDKDGKIILLNESFRNIAEKKTLHNKFYWEVFSLVSTELVTFIENGLKNKKNVINEIKIKENIYLCSLTFIHRNGGIIVVLHDITELKKLDKIKKDFVVNVSHELRTPLTVIKGYIETLEDEASERQKEYFDIIQRHTDRLILIVEDLLMLSKLEDHTFKLELKEVNIGELIAGIINIFKQKIAHKNLNLKPDLNKDIIIFGDEFKLTQVFINLIDNAIKYTKAGEIKIHLSKDEQNVKIIIEDTGIGIPPKDLSRIFERFYVANKAHSRELGGTGLGLSIVKHIVMLHNGDITVESEINKGTKFVILLPLK